MSVNNLKTKKKAPRNNSKNQYEKFAFRRNLYLERLEAKERELKNNMEIWARMIKNGC